MRVSFLRRLAELIVVALATLVSLSLTAAAADEPAPAPQEYQLDVSINQQPTGLVARFVDLGDGRFASPASELRQLGIKVSDDAPDAELIPLSGLSGLSYVYDEAKQAIALEISDDHRIRKIYDARGDVDVTKTTPADYGAVINYTIFGASGDDGFSVAGTRANAFSGLNASLDTRLISPLGILNQTAIVGMTLAEETNGLRLETTYTFTDEEHLATWRAGDFITGGTSWSRPVRMGGAQVQRNFSVRPDLVTTPLPAVSGSAAVPSTVDVFVNGIKSYSKDVGAGPYQIDNVPSISGAGVAQVVTRDAAGRETVQSLSFYSSPRLLKPGFYDFSAEVGLPRLSYGVNSFDYDEKLVGSATLRSGVTDWLTAETHAEIGSGVYNAGIGAAARPFNLGIVAAAVSGSSSERGAGAQLYGSFETKVGHVSINARAQHAFGAYDDIAAATARSDPNRFGLSSGIGPAFGARLYSLSPPRTIDSLTVSVPLAFDKSNISATVLRYEPDFGTSSDLITASYTRPLPYDANLFATGYVDLKEHDSLGVYLGVSVPLGNNTSVSTALNGRVNDLALSTEASKPVGQEAGSWGWRVRDYEGPNTYRTVEAEHRFSQARVGASVRQDKSGARVAGEVEGAIAMLGGDVYLANHIDDSFAIVDTHEPGVKVLRENLLVGTTNDDGKILIPSLNSYQKNKISIDPMDLPITAEIGSTVDYVTPGFKSGVRVGFDVKKAAPSAIVILKYPDGTFIPAGSDGQLDGSAEIFTVGYDGQAFIRNLSTDNTAHVTIDGKSCTAHFSFTEQTDTQPTIGPEICQ